MKKLKNKGSEEPVQRSGVPSASEENLVRCNLLRQFMLKSYDEYKKKQHKNGSPSDLLLRRENEIDESTRNCSLRGTVYVDPLSNSQCKTIMSNSNDNVYFRNRFVEMISEFGTFLLAELVVTLAKAGVDDDVIPRFHKKEHTITKTENATNDDAARVGIVIRLQNETDSGDYPETLSSYDVSKNTRCRLWEWVENSKNKQINSVRNIRCRHKVVGAIHGRWFV